MEIQIASCCDCCAPIAAAKWAGSADRGVPLAPTMDYSYPVLSNHFPTIAVSLFLSLRCTQSGIAFTFNELHWTDISEVISRRLSVARNVNDDIAACLYSIYYICMCGLSKCMQRRARATQLSNVGQTKAGWSSRALARSLREWVELANVGAALGQCDCLKHLQVCSTQPDRIKNQVLSS